MGDEHENGEWFDDDGGPTIPGGGSARSVLFAVSGKAIRELGETLELIGRHIDRLPPQDQLAALEESYSTCIRADEQLEDLRRNVKGEIETQSRLVSEMSTPEPEVKP